jgi:hypothetical protein
MCKVYRFSTAAWSARAGGEVTQFTCSRRQNISRRNQVGIPTFIGQAVATAPIMVQHVQRSETKDVISSLQRKNYCNEN